MSRFSEINVAVSEAPTDFGDVDVSEDQLPILFHFEGLKTLHSRTIYPASDSSPK